MDIYVYADWQGLQEPRFIGALTILHTMGGARPKASVLDEKQHLWIAKFPSVKDSYDIGAWEMVVNQLAFAAGVNATEGIVRQFNSEYHTFLSRRFDRTVVGDRIHFASALTLLGLTDGSQTASYLDLAEFIIRHGASANADRRQRLTWP
jgi:serine/threonine-protein kinase HipA